VIDNLIPSGNYSLGTALNTFNFEVCVNLVPVWLCYGLV